MARALAILLITNSHLGFYYPRPGLAAGGMIGNCIFFIVSGWALTVALSDSTERLGPWLARRLTRLYAPLCVVVTILIFLGRYIPANFHDLFSAYLYPSEFWFVPAIAAFYIPIYFVIHYWRNGLAAWSVGFTLLTVYFVNYMWCIDVSIWSIEKTVQSKIFFYMIAMFLGVVMAERDLPEGLGSASLLAAGAAIGYLVLQKILRSEALLPWQFLAQLTGLTFALAVVHVLAQLARRSRVRGSCSRIIDYLSSRSLQIYICQVPMLDWKPAKTLSFPWNLGAFILVTLAAAEVLYRISSKEGWRSLIQFVKRHLTRARGPGRNASH
ncbi:acyltransferase [Sphingomonas sp.]|nr:acyltransferase [Sphingomonas sp.]